MAEKQVASWVFGYLCQERKDGWIIVVEGEEVERFDGWILFEDLIKDGENQMFGIILADEFLDSLDEVKRRVGMRSQERTAVLQVF